MDTAAPMSPAQRMDRMYRYTRHIYDLTRRPYLLGRNEVLAEMAAQPAASVLEVGCGTARNLRKLHEQAPQHTLYGLDASAQMLDTARASCAHNGQREVITLKQGLAQDVQASLFGRTVPFDMILCSYVLSMIPNAASVVDAALAAVRPGGHVYIVDFWDQRTWPAPARYALQQWLSWFGVRHRPALHAHLDVLASRGRIRLKRTSVAYRYAYQAVLVKHGSG